MKEIAVILSGYKRTFTLEEQYNAIINQSVKNIDIILWMNQVYDVTDNIKEKIIPKIQTITSNANYGVWGRFAIALNARAKYIFIIDDDTIPGPLWLQNCLDTIEKYDGIITTRGVLLDKNNKRDYPTPNSYTAHGWCKPNEEVMKVDFGCHSWFFEKNILREFWANMPDDIPGNFGEDMHLSYVAKNFCNKNTYVAPHPSDNIDMWGSNPTLASKYGEDENAISRNYIANLGMNSYVNFIINNDFKIVAEETNE